ncbi:PEGA domain-containing protein [Candidatus Saccharibacteria bacterium]|nr:PEGA domain-containing protein [Candidatus Saccharibacteria bacterium]
MAQRFCSLVRQPQRSPRRTLSYFPRKGRRWIINNSIKKRLIIVAIITFIIAAIAAIIIAVYFQINSATLKLHVAPSFATITINDDPTSRGNKHLRPGNYTVTISAEGFSPYSESITLEAGETKELVVGLISNDPSTANYYETHPEDAEIYTWAASIDFSKKSQQQLADYPILNYLPLKNSSYSIGTGPCNEAELCVKINAADGFYGFAIEALNNSYPDNDIARYHVLIGDNYINAFSSLNQSIIPVTPAANSDSSSSPSTNTILQESNQIRAAANALLQDADASIIAIHHPSDVWGFAKLQYNPTEEPYRILFYKTATGWQPASKIDIFLKYADYPGITRDIIRQLNAF